jgi:hypothetical protein
MDTRAKRIALCVKYNILKNSKDIKKIKLDGCAGKDPNKKEQIFPLLMRNNCSVFCFKDCTFLLQKDREGSARVIFNLC